MNHSYHVVNNLLDSTNTAKQYNINNLNNFSTTTKSNTTNITSINALLTDPDLYALKNRTKSSSCSNITAATTTATKQQPAEIKPLNNQLVSTNRLAYVEALVDINAVVIESIWHPNSTNCINNSNNSTKSATRVSPVVPLRTFIQEVLKRSRTTYSTLQTALFYLFRARPTILNHLSNNSNAYICCGRRMFLASLVVASKFVQDKTYRNSAWAKIAGLPVSEINTSERYFLNMLNYRLYIDQTIFDHWHKLLHLRTQARMHHIPTYLIDLLSFPNLSFAPLLKESSSPPPLLQLSYPSTFNTTTTTTATKSTINQLLLLSPPTILQQQQQKYHHTYYSAQQTPPPFYYTQNSHNSPSSTSTTSTTTSTTIHHYSHPTTMQQQHSKNCICPNCSPSILPPALSLSSLPSSISSSPAQTPTSTLQVSPVRGVTNKRKHENREHVAILDKKHRRFWQ